MVGTVVSFCCALGSPNATVAKFNTVAVDYFRKGLSFLKCLLINWRNLRPKSVFMLAA